MEKTTHVLMQLRDNHDGYAGITQETQLLFSSFLDSSTIYPSGLLVKYGAHDFRRLSRGIAANQKNTPQTAEQHIKCLSDFILSYQSNKSTNKLLPSLKDMFFLPFNIFYLNCLTSLGCSIAVDHFDGQGFENFLWEFFFSKILPASDYNKLTRASFRTIRYSVNLMQLAGLFAIAYPKLDTRDYDIFLAQNPYPVRVANNTQLVIRYHDSIPLFAPHLTNFAKFQQTFHYRALKLNAKKGVFACVSTNVRHDLLRVFPSLEQRSVVIHDLVSSDYFWEEKSRHALSDIVVLRGVQTKKKISFSQQDVPFSFPYLLMVSTIEPRKNHLRMIKAWEIARVALRLDLKLIVVGKIGWNCESIIDAMEPWQERGELFHLHNVPIPELRVLYKEAACVVCPSMMEGFDLSGIEAMLCGGKVAASNIPVHREVYGSAAVYFDPYSIDDQSNVIESLVSPENATFAATLSVQGRQWGMRYQKDAIISQWEDFFERIQAGEFNSSINVRTPEQVVT